MAVFIGSKLSPNTGFGTLHPLGQTRQAAVRQLCNQLGWLEEADIIAPCPAPPETLERFHRRDYVSALREASFTGSVSTETRAAFNFGTMENPIFKGVYDRAAATVGGSILAAQQALEGQVAYHPAGGTHHGRPDRAAGFCYFNDPVFALLTFLDAGIDRVGYVDLDAHHGDGVQDAMGSDPRVILASIHEAGRWPGTGALDDQAASGLARNAPVPRGLNDTEFLVLVRDGILPHLQRHGVETAVITCGADCLAGDPLSGMDVSNQALWRAVSEILEIVPRAVIVGGGGYNPWTTTRAWAGLWGLLQGADINQLASLDPLSSASQALLGSFSSDLVDEEDVLPHWLTHLQDPPHTGAKRPEIDTILKAWES